LPEAGLHNEWCEIRCHIPSHVEARRLGRGSKVAMPLAVGTMVVLAACGHGRALESEAPIPPG
jgi:hypothetical protein